MSNIVGHQRRLLARAFAVEAIGAAILTARFSADYPFVQALKLGIFHSISAFCNAGFDILGFREPGISFMQIHTDPIVCITAAALVILGGLGFLVWDDVLREKNPRRWNVYTRLVLVTTGVLLLGGMLSVCLLEWNNPATLGSLPFGQKLLAAFFQSMTLRTAGFAGLDQSLLTPAGKAVSIFLMLIGGSSGSTAGGLKTVTFVVLLMFLWNRMRGRYTVSVFHRTISDDHVLNAIPVDQVISVNQRADVDIRGIIAKHFGEEIAFGNRRMGDDQLIRKLDFLLRLLCGSQRQAGQQHNGRQQHAQDFLQLVHVNQTLSNILGTSSGIPAGLSADISQSSRPHG